ncbi:LmbU family transcriptional regulator [Streptomyces taklimakanensis]|uniref:LmbU family transcriptional regulator n=1 Tax=Streptomyces taklimakanensis TaxID=2569853 RepID=UPI003B75BB12
MSLDDWRSIGEQISVISDSSSRWLGDWLMHSQEKYPGRYQQAIEKTSLDYQTLRNYAWIARKFPPSRRRDGLSLQHHAEVASLSRELQDRWLGQAERYGWSRNELRRRIKAGLKPSPERRPSTNVRVSVSAERRTRWEKAAANRGRNSRRGSSPCWTSPPPRPAVPPPFPPGPDSGMEPTAHDPWCLGLPRRVPRRT